MPVSALEDRLAGVANGSFDLTISALSFTPGREAVLHFVRWGELLCLDWFTWILAVGGMHRAHSTSTWFQSIRPCRPFYYSSGVALFADTSRRGLALLGPGPQGGQDLTAPAGWRGVFSGGGGEVRGGLHANQGPLLFLQRKPLPPYFLARRKLPRGSDAVLRGGLLRAALHPAGTLLCKVALQPVWQAPPCPRAPAAQRSGLLRQPTASQLCLPLGLAATRMFS